MLINQKRNCNGCIAYKNVPRNGVLPTECALDYPIENRTIEGDTHGFAGYGIPLIPCPKPLKNTDYIYASEWYRCSKLRAAIVRKEHV